MKLKPYIEVGGDGAEPMASTVMVTVAIAVGGHEHHLSLPAIRTEGPTASEYHRLSCDPIFVRGGCGAARINQSIWRDSW
jgi:hypothetical protein